MKNVKFEIQIHGKCDAVNCNSDHEREAVKRSYVVLDTRCLDAGSTSLGGWASIHSNQVLGHTDLTICKKCIDQHVQQQIKSARSGVRILLPIVILIVLIVPIVTLYLFHQSGDKDIIYIVLAPSGLALLMLGSMLIACLFRMSGVSCQRAAANELFQEAANAVARKFPSQHPHGTVKFVWKQLYEPSSTY